MATQFDAIIIGTGQAGPSLAVRLASAGMKTAIVASLFSRVTNRLASRS
jgi:pyruvate/2-oxoglutarate dehydrogenase complex dihydrolipoamide dehydrogenase (E3) component